MLDLLRAFPAEIEWLVAFRLGAILPHAAGAVPAEAIFLLESGRLRPDDAYAVLTASGRYLVDETGAARPGDAVAPPLHPPATGGGLADRHAELLAMVEAGSADCVGFGQAEGHGPVAMAVTIRDGTGSARAAFERPPSCRHFELLPAVGVDHLGHEAMGDRTLVRFENRLPEHLLAGVVSAFARTHHCNLFFLRHGEVDPQLEQGLIAAGEARLRLAVRVLQAQAVRAALDARGGDRAMTCLPPSPRAPFPYGDLVPLGLLLRALRRFPGDKAIDAGAQLLQRHLDRRRQGRLWSFHSGGLPTATDSALILLGHGDRDGIAALEEFAVPGGILPQLADAEGTAGRMRAGPENAHWRQPDLATTCLVRWLQREAGLPVTVPLAAITAAPERRAGLYFANPYLIDWCLAEAVHDEPDAAPIRDRIAAEIAASANPDFSFGRYDVVLSTALAILALAALGRRGRLLRAAQLRLLREVDGATAGPPPRPFYYTFAAGGAADRLPMPVQGRIAVAGQLHDLHLLEDTYRHLTVAVLLLALDQPCDPAVADLPPPERTPHARYACATAVDYVREHALPRYLASARD